MLQRKEVLEGFFCYEKVTVSRVLKASGRTCNCDTFILCWLNDSHRLNLGGAGINLMGIAKIKVADFLSAILFAPVIYNITNLILNLIWEDSLSLQELTDCFFVIQKDEAKWTLLRHGRDDRIWTCGPYVPNVVLYQTEPHPVLTALQLYHNWHLKSIFFGKIN